MTLVNEQGSDLPPRHLTTLLLKMLPSDVYEDVKRMHVIHSPYQEIVNYLKIGTHRCVDKKGCPDAHPTPVLLVADGQESPLVHDGRVLGQAWGAPMWI